MNKDSKKTDGLEENVVIEDKTVESTTTDKTPNFFNKYKKSLLIGIIAIILIGGSGAAFLGIEEFNENKPIDISALKINETQAEKIAISKMSGGSIVEIKVDREDGRIVYEVEAKKDNKYYEFEIDANSGEIVEEKMKIIDESSKITKNNVEKSDSITTDQEVQ